MIGTFFRSKRSVRRNSTKEYHSVAPLCEALESRVLLAASLAANGTQNLVRNAALNVSNTPNFPREAELSIAINPTNPLNMVGVSYTGSSYLVYEYWTFDGGITWTSRQINQAIDSDTAGRFNPVAAFDANGALYMTYVGGSTGLRLLTSINGGATLDVHPAIPTSSGVDKPEIVCGLETVPGTSTRQVSVYITWATLSSLGIGVTGAHSSDILNWTSGQGNFSAPSFIPLSSTFSQFAQPAVGPNGELYVSWTSEVASQVYVATDLDGLQHGVVPIAFSTPTVAYSNAGSGLFRWSIPPTTNRGVSNNPSIAVDPISGDLYIALVAFQNPITKTGFTQVLLTRCTNPDATTPTWDAATSIDANSQYEFQPTLAVDGATGSVNVVYYTTEGNPASDYVHVRPRLSTSFNSTGTWSALSFTRSNLTDATSSPVAPDDYLEYLGAAALNNTVVGFWGSSHGTTTDMDAYFASVALTSANNVLTVNGDDVVGTNDNIIIRRDPFNPNYLDAIVNGQIQFAGLFSTVNQINVDGKAGDNTISVDFSNGNPVPGGLISLVGGSSSTMNTLKVIGAAGGNTFSTSGTHSLIVNGASISYAKFKALIVSGGAGNDTLNDAGVPSDVTFAGGAGTDTLNLTGGTLAFNADTSLTTTNLKVNVSVGATALFNTTQNLPALTINGTAVMPSNVIGTPINVNTLSIGSVGLLDLGRSFLYVDNTATPFALVHQYIDAGFNRNTTTGFGDYAGLGGITSADVKANIDYKGVGYYDGALQTPGNANNIGQILGPNANSGAGTGIALTRILIRPTLTGDINGDGVVNSYDVNLFNSFGLFNMATPLGYQVGDFNGDGVVNSKDVTIFNSAGNFNNGVYV